MRIFLSYSTSDRHKADEIHLALLGAGHSVFFDRESLPPGGEYFIRIREAVASCERFLFLISPASVSAGSFTLTEIQYAREKWQHPRDRVLPVIVKPVAFEDIPPYLKAVTILQPQGNVAAEVVSALTPNTLTHADSTDNSGGQRESRHRFVRDRLESYSNWLLAFFVLQTIAFLTAYGLSPNFRCLIATDRILVISLALHFALSLVLVSIALWALRRGIGRTLLATDASARLVMAAHVGKIALAAILSSIVLGFLVPVVTGAGQYLTTCSLRGEK